MEHKYNKVNNRNLERGFDYFFESAQSVSTDQVTLLADCRRAFECMLSRVAAATQRVWLQMYVFDDDALGRCFERALVGCVERGVDVRVLCDGYGCRFSRLTLLRRLRRAGVRVAVEGFRRGEWPDCRNHRKMLVTDDVAVIGGVNIAMRYLRGWRDVCVEIRGESVERFAALFEQDWNSARGERVEMLVEKCGNTAVECIGRGGEEVFVQMVKRARQRVLLCTPYLVPTRRVERSLAECVERGVEVSVLVPARSDTPLTGVATMEYVGRLVRRGVGVWHYVAGFSHAKVLVADGVAMVGSMNCDRRSLRRNREVMALLRGPVVEEIAADFAHALTFSRRVGVERKSVVRRVAELLVRPLHPLL